MEQWHHLGLDEVFSRLKTSPHGLTQEEVAARLAKHGTNELMEKKQTPAWVRFLRQFMSPVIYVLLVAAVIALSLREYADAGVILGVLIINAIIGFVQEGKAARAVAALRKLTSPFATLRRDGKEVVVPAREVVPGDVLLVHSGDRFAADARVIESAALQTLEGSLTGESTSVSKRAGELPPESVLADRKNMLFKGTVAATGRATAVVVSTGMATELGKIARMVQEAKEPPTPLQTRMEQLGRAIIVTVVALIVVVFGLGLLRKLELREIFMVAVSQAVSAIPEGMPVALTIALAVGMQRMARRRAVLRKLAAVETLGGVTVICSDKTGTLTKNEMTVVRLWTPEGLLEITGAGYEPVGRFNAPGGEEVTMAAGSTRSELLRCGALCNDSTLVPPSKDTPAWTITGDPTEGALVVVAAKAGINVAELRQKDRRVWEIPFDAVSRMMATGHAVRDDPGCGLQEHEGSGPVIPPYQGGTGGCSDFARDSARTTPSPPLLGGNSCSAPTIPPYQGGTGGCSDHAQRVYVKGAPEAVLGLCSSYRRGEEIRCMDESLLTEIAQTQQEMAESALRVLGFACADLNSNVLDDRIESLCGRMTFLGLMGELDPPRPEVREAIALCKQAGVRTVMVTGDHVGTGKAIGDALGIGERHSRAVEGVELAKMSRHELDEAIDDVSVFARIAPEQKVRIVDAFQRMGDVVAMTGDGVNDAPALAEADVGIAMGITGTEVTKEAAAMVITDDNFVTIVSAIEEGRVIYNNVRKTILYLLSTNAAEMLTLLSALASGLMLPLRAAQILWVNLVTDGALTVTLIMEKREGDEMTHPPIRRDEPIISMVMLIRMLLLVLVMGLGTLGLFAWELGNGYSPAHAQTAAFTLLVVYQWFNGFNCRSDSRSIFRLGFHTNLYVLIGVMAAVALQLAAVYLPFMQRLMGTVPLDIDDWLRIVALASMVTWADEVFKWFVRKKPHLRRRKSDPRP